MALDKATLLKLKRFEEVFAAARERNANESDTVMYLIEFFKDLLDYDPLRGEITKEVAVKDRYCDFAVKLGEEIAFLVEAKSAAIKALAPKHIEQAGNYASRAGINWVLLTNGVEWQLYHLDFSSGIEHDLVFALHFLDEMQKNPEHVWDALSILGKANVRQGALEAYYAQKKLLSPKTVVKVLLGEEVLMKVRQELNRQADSRLEMKDVFRAVMEVLSKDALVEAGDIAPPIKKRRRRRRRRADGAIVEVEVAEDEKVAEGEVDLGEVEEPAATPAPSPASAGTKVPSTAQTPPPAAQSPTTSKPIAAQ